MQQVQSQKRFNQAWSLKHCQFLVSQRDGFQALIWAALVNFFLFYLFFTFATPAYETNDDLMMQMISSGFLTGHPDEHLVFTSVIIGWMLKFFYGVWAGCNWYLIYLLSVHYVALTIIAFLGVSRRGGWLFTLLYLVFFLINETHILIHLQFTTTAFLIGTAGFLLVADGLRPENPPNWPKIIAGFACAGTMHLIREPVAMLLAGIAFPFLVERIGLTQWRRLLGISLVFAGICLALHVINRCTYLNNPAWSEFSKYNQMRGEIHVTPLARFIPQAAATVGWSKNDGLMFSQFYFPDPEVYGGVEKMQRFLDKLKDLAKIDPTYSKKFTADYFYLPAIFTDDARTLMKLALLNVILCILFAGSIWRRCLITLLITYGILVALCFYLEMSARLPERISFNFPMFINTICLYWATCLFNPATKITLVGCLSIFFSMRLSAKIAWLAAMTIVAYLAKLYLLNLDSLCESLWSANSANHDLKIISRKIFKPVQELIIDHQVPILIAMPFDSVLEKCIFFDSTAENVPVSMVPYGWITQSPIFTQILERNHLKPYSLSLLDREDVYFLMLNPRWLGSLMTFYREHYGLEVRFDLVLNTDTMPQFADCKIYLYQAHIVKIRSN